MLSGIGLITLKHLILSVVHEIWLKTCQKKFVVVSRLVEILIVEKRIQLFDLLVHKPEKASLLVVLVVGPSSATVSIL